MSDSVPTVPAAPDQRARALLVHRELLQLIVLIVLAVGAFFLTRAVAASNRTMTLRDADEWYRRGQTALAQGKVDDAVDAFRRAVARNRQERRYVLELSEALARRHDEEGARAALLALRESAPDDPDVNLALARLAAGRHDLTEALRFYRAALYAPWDPNGADERRRTRLELVRFLLAHNDRRRAAAELMAVDSELPGDAAAHVEVGTLFAQTGDWSRALADFEQALKVAPRDPQALVGAGRAAFRIGDYVRARTYLRQAPATLDEASRMLSTVEFVLANDPLATRVGAAERRRRLRVDLAYTRQRMAGCPQTAGGEEADAVLQQALTALENQLKAPARLEQEAVEAGVDLVERIAKRVVATCGPATPVDEALLIIGSRHRGESS